MKGHWVHVANVVLVVTSVGIGGGAYAGGLPARMGVLPWIALSIVAMFYGGAWWVQRDPSALNLPNQAAYDALTEADQQKVIACVLPFFYGSAALWMGFGMVVLSVPTTEVVVGAAILANLVEGGLVLRHILLKAPQKVREL